MLIARHFDPAQEKLGFLHEDSYLVLNPYISDYSEQELIEKIEEYLQRFEEKKSEYQYYKENWKKRKKN